MKNVFYNTFGNIFYSFCQWLITIVVVYLENYEFGAAGILSLAMTTSSSFSAISLFSMRNYQISDTKGEFLQGQYVSSRIITCAAAFVACIIYAIPGNNLFQILCIVAFMLVRIAESFADVLFGVDQMHDRYGLICLSCTLRGIMTAGSFIVVMRMTHNLVLTLFTMAVLNLLIVVIIDVRMTFKLEKIIIKLKDKSLIKLFKQCLPLVVFTFLLSLVNLMPKQVLNMVQGEDALGVYSSIASPTLVVQVFASVAFAPFIPKLAQLLEQKEYDKFLKIQRFTYIGLAVLAGVVLAGAALLGRPALFLLFKEDILEYYDLFIPIVCCTILLAGVWVIDAIVVTVRRLKILLIGMAVDFVILCLITYPCISIYGQNGTSYAQIIALGMLLPFMAGICEFDIQKRKKLAGA
jgi:O-antigen/teichoic acid export membrane protein